MEEVIEDAENVLFDGRIDVDGRIDAEGSSQPSLESQTNNDKGFYFYLSCFNNEM